jgi:hypothetical protein
MSELTINEAVALSMKRSSVEQEQGWREKIDVIPYISFPPEWRVKIIPPYSGAYARFHVEKGEGWISVYLDLESRLGYFDGGDPYWELHPYDDDCYRCAMNDTDELIWAINEVLAGTDGQNEYAATSAPAPESGNELEDVETGASEAETAKEE